MMAPTAYLRFVERMPIEQPRSSGFVAQQWWARSDDIQTMGAHCSPTNPHIPGEWRDIPLEAEIC